MKKRILHLMGRDGFTLCMLGVFVTFLFSGSRHVTHPEADAMAGLFAATALGLMGVLTFGLCEGVYGLDKHIIRKFFNNSISHSWSSILFIFLFIAECNWVADAGLSIFQGEEHALPTLFLYLCSIVLLFLIYPNHRSEKTSIDQRTLLLSAISFRPDGKLPLSESSLLTCADDGHIVINHLPTRGFLYPLEKYPYIHTLLVAPSTSAFATLPQLRHQPFPRWCEAYGGKAWMEGMTFDDVIEQGLNDREWLGAWLELVARLYLNDPTRRLKVIVSEMPVDYDDFESCYHVIGNLLHRYEADGSTSHTVINISPGTSAISGVMTIYAIKGGRLATYNRQNAPEEENPNKEFGIDVLSVKDLIDEIEDELDNRN